MLKPVSIIILSLFILTACVGSGMEGIEITPEPTATPTPEPTGRGVGDTLRILNREAPVTLNPHLAEAIKDWEACRITYEPLASFDRDGQMVLFLAAEAPSLENGGVAEDGLSVTWKLKQNIQWSDGEPFTADDVLFTYEYITNPTVESTSADFYTTVERVEVIDDYTVQVHFKEPNPAWAVPFVGIQGMIIPRHKFEEYNGANAREAPANDLPVGTGPYQVMPPGIKTQEVLFLGNELIETNKTVFEPNPYFREEDKPYFSEVELQGGGTVNEAARAVLSDGRVDYAYFLSLPPEMLLELEEAGPGRLVQNFGSTVDRILLNHTDPHQESADGERSSLEVPHPFFQDKTVRQAFAYAVNRERISEQVYGPAGRPTYNNLVAPPQYSSSNIFYRFDLEEAAALLDEAGWTDTNGDGFRDKEGERLKVVYQAPLGESEQQIQQIVKEDLESIGVEVELKIVDSSIMFNFGSSNPNTFWRFNADLQETWITSPSLDPAPYMQYWTCAQIPQQENNWTAGNNAERWCNPEYDALLQQAASELDPEKRQELFIQMNDMLIEDVVMIPMVHVAQVSGANENIEGIELTPWDSEVWNIKDWRRVSP